MLKKLLYTIWLVLFLFTIVVSVRNTDFENFISMIENRTFDLRQNVMIKEHTKVINDDIVIVAIDDATYEYILDKYGEWPLPRSVYAELVNYIEKQQPRSIAFDLMFVKSMKSNPKADQMLVDMMKKYDNVFVAMNLDNQDADLRTPPKLPESISVNVINRSASVDFSEQTYTNCRSIIKGILDNSSNIGMINVTRADDGILRKMPVFVKYDNKFYPQLGLKVGIDYLKRDNKIGDKNFVIDSNSNLLLGNRKIYLDKDGSAILNWYGAQETYEYIPMYKLIQAAEGKHFMSDINLKGKVVYFGTTASSLFDIKTVPSS